MFSLIFHSVIVLCFNLLWLYQRKWEGFKEIYGFREEPYDEVQLSLVKLIWVYSLSGLFTLLLLLYKLLIY